MGMKEKIVRKQAKKILTALGHDISNPKQIVFKSMTDLIDSSIPSLLTPKEMVMFLKNLIEKIEKEWGV